MNYLWVHQQALVAVVHDEQPQSKEFNRLFGHLDRVERLLDQENDVPGPGHHDASHIHRHSQLCKVRLRHGSDQMAVVHISATSVAPRGNGVFGNNVYQRSNLAFVDPDYHPN